VPPDRTYSTELGGHAVIKFADNTQIELNTNTVARVRMTTAERTVWLEKGEAWFEVSHDAAHPFSVIVGGHRITDLGTEFLVRRMPDGMEVALVKGEAALKSESAQTAILSPGDDAVATAQSTTIMRKTPWELADALGWRRDMLEFRNTRLADAVREFNRYNATKLIIADPSIADLKVSAEMQKGNYEGFLQLAEDVFDLRIERDGREIRIFGASRKAAHAKRGR
jgi:transmembrane sensor